MEKEDRVKQVINAIDGMELMDVVDVIGEAINSCEKKDLCLVPIWYIGKLMEEAHARSTLIKIDDDGSLSMSIAANGVEQKLF